MSPTVKYDISQADNASLEIMNAMGIVVATYAIDPTSNQYVLYCNGLATGQYTLVLKCNGQRKDAKVLVIE